MSKIYDEMIPQGGCNYTLMIRYKTFPTIEGVQSVEEMKVYCNTKDEIKSYFHLRGNGMGNLMVVSVYDKEGKKVGFLDLKTLREQGEEKWMFIENH